VWTAYCQRTSPPKNIQPEILRNKNDHTYVPSFFPKGSSYLTPIHQPLLKWTVPAQEIYIQSQPAAEVENLWIMYFSSTQRMWMQCQDEIPFWHLTYEHDGSSSNWLTWYTHFTAVTNFSSLCSNFISFHFLSFYFFFLLHFLSIIFA